MFYEKRGGDDGVPIVFAHGWDRNHEDFIPTVELVGDAAPLVLLDLHGFGQTPRPKDDWTTQDYALAIKDFLEAELGITKFMWVGHSFGGRIGLRLASMNQSPVEHLFIVAGAGVKLPQPIMRQIKGKWRSWQFKKKKAAATTEEALIALEKAFGSPDYVQSRESGMRDIFVRTVQEDQTAELSRIACPTTLLYGAEDTETPPAVGKALHRGILHATYVECPEFDHLTILSRGRHQLTTLILETLGQGEAS
ncbi:alpha/beta hydrolase [Rhodobacteraceae bacterium]|nr:alpha/beta hydrolase [Paracoccaceae bacterium]